MKRMASPQYTAKALFNAIVETEWNEVRSIIRRQPQLVNEKYLDWSLLYLIVLHSAPRDVVGESLKSATTETVDWVAPMVRGGDCILHRIASLGYAHEMRQALRISATNVNLQDDLNRETPLHCLLKKDHQFSDHLNITRFLLDAGADVNVENEDNQTPLDLYKKNKCKEYESTNRKKHKEEVLQLLQGISVPEVIMTRGEEALKVFNRELQEGQITVNHARLMVTGKEGVGKTCLVNTLLEKSFNEAEPSTDGIVLTTAFQTDVGCNEWRKIEDIDECEMTKNIHDNALYGEVVKELKLKGSHTNPVHKSKRTRVRKLIGRVFFPFSQKGGRKKPSTAQEYGVMSGPREKEHEKDEKKTNRTSSSSQSLPSEISKRELKEDKQKTNQATSSSQVLTSEIPKRIPELTEGSSQALPSEIQERLVDRITGMTFQDIDNKDMTYIWDFAGQQLYYITHRIFLTSEAVYLILFNLMESMYDKGKKRAYKGDKNVMTYHMTNIQIIKYWMRLIFTYAVPVESLQQQLQAKKPQIAVVGTHSESLPGTDEDKKKKIEEQFAIIFEEIKGTPYECHVVRKMYAIDNKFPLQSEMLTTLKQDVGGFLKAMPKTIPLKWLEFQHILQENGRTAMRMTYDEVCEVASKCGISVDNLIHTLNYLHDLGIILYFENNRLLKHTVITNPRKLIDIFRKIITVVEPDDHDMWATMIKFWNKLDDEGILEEELVRHLWRDEISKDETSFEVFLELMKQFGLLCEQIKNQESTYRSFFVPCRLKRSKDNVLIERDTAQMASIYMASEDFIPDSVFHPLVVSLIGMVQDMGYTAMLELFSNYANIRLGLEHTLSLGPVVIKNKPSLKLEILRVPITLADGTKTQTGEPSPRVCMQVLEFLKKEMKALTSGMKHTRYKFRVLCWTSLREMHFHDLEECLENTVIPCGRESITTDKLQRMFKNKQLVTDSSMQGAGSSDTKTAPPDERLGYLEDKHLLDIAEGMGRECKQLGVRLGLSWNRIQQIWSDNRRLSEFIMDMLTEWKKQQNYEKNQVEIMCCALMEQGLTELANNVFGSQTSDSSLGLKAHRQLRQRHQKYDGFLADIDMQFIAKELGREWKSFGSIIGLKEAEIERIEMDFSPPTVDACLEMLIKWRERQNTEVNHLVKMRDALEKLGKADVAKDLQKYYQENYQK